MKLLNVIFAGVLMMSPCLADEFDDVLDGGSGGASLNADADVVNVASFDIAGIFLNMQYEDIDMLFFQNRSLYSPLPGNSVRYAIYEDWEPNLDYECRQKNITAPIEVKNCITGLARNRGLLFVSQVNLIRESTGEKITIHFTSNATDNRVWKIVYTNDVDTVEGMAPIFQAQRDKKVLAWWQSVIEKYGEPNAGADTWMSSSNEYDPKMTAYYGSLELQDLGLKVSDDTKNIQQARAGFKPKAYAF